MDAETLDSYLETLAGHVFDNDKLVTYKWLSKELQIHVNIAKQILWKFWQKHQKNKDIECTYLLIGNLKDNGMRVEVVKESNLLKAKDKFSKIISEHLYSIHKPIADIELLAKAEGGDVKYSAIKCDACIQRNDEEMDILRWGATAKKEISVKTVKESTINSKSVNSAHSITASTKSDKKPLTTKKNSDTQKNEFNNFFNKPNKQDSTDEVSKLLETEKDTKAEKADNTKNNAAKRKPKGTLDVSSKQNKKGSLNHFFEKSNKQNNAMPESVDKIQEATIADKNHDTVEKEQSKKEKEEENTRGKKRNHDTVEKEQRKKEKEEENTRGKKRNRSQKTNAAIKRRKRIVVQSDSSDSEVQSESEDIELSSSPELAAEPVKPRSPSPPQVKRENGKRKVLKLVNKTYKQGEYIVTKKEHVYVSCSEDEIDEEKVMPKPELKTDIKVKKKQTMLTNFFKKS